MPPTPTVRQSFDRQAFLDGLLELSRRIPRSRVLAPFRPLELVATGGFVSVISLGNRPASEDLDYFLSEKQLGSSYESVRTELQSLASQVASKLGYDTKWANDEVRVFLTLLRDPDGLFTRSKEQGIVLYKDDNLTIYAVLWEWVLVRKLKRLGMEGQRPRNEDWNDCVAICYLLYNRTGAPLDLNIFTQFDDTNREPPVSDKVLVDLTRLMRRLKGIDPFQNRRLQALMAVAEAGSALQSPAQTRQGQEYWAWSSQAQRWAFIVEGQGSRPQSEWPTPTGRRQVYCTDDKTWKWFDFNRKSWE